MSNRRTFILIILITALLTGCISKKDNLLSLVKGNWIADGTQYEIIQGFDENGNPILEEDLKPFYLDFDGKGSYEMKLNGYTEYGSYEVDEENEVILISNDGFVSEHCILKNDIELHCHTNASLYIKN